MEIDAISATRLRQLVTDCIERHIDPDRLDRVRGVEAVERQSLEIALATWGKPA